MREASGATRTVSRSYSAGLRRRIPKSAMSTPAQARTVSVSKLRLAIAIPTTAKVEARPAASASGPKRWRSSAAKTTKGSTGRMQGESVVSVPASSPSRRLTTSEGLVEHRPDGAFPRFIDGARELGSAFVEDEGALAGRLEAPHRAFLRVEIDAQPDDLRIRGPR